MDCPVFERARILRWRQLRWLLCAASAPALWACSTHRLAAPDEKPSVADVRQFRQNVNHKLDILFMVDDSASMKPLQAKMAAQLPMFMDQLVDKSTGQLPDLHVAVISSSYGGGAWANVNQCHSGSYPGDDQGKFQQGPGGAGNGSCPGWPTGQRYLKTGDGTAANPPNFQGDIRPLFQCMALLGDGGCGFESQFESTYAALVKAKKPEAEDPDNGGFVREDALLAIVMLTNEDDCSVRDDTLILDPSPARDSAKDPVGLGAFQSYRCNEFGHVCGGAALPHGYDFGTMSFDIPAGTLSTPGSPGTGGKVLHDCVSAEDTGPKMDPMATAMDDQGNVYHDGTMGHLWPTVNDFTNYLKTSVKSDPNNVLVAAITGPVESMGATYRVVPVKNQNGEMDLWVDHSCTQPSPNGGDPEYGDPAVRIAQWVGNFGANGVIYPICADSFAPAMIGIANKIHEKLGASCLAGNIATRSDGGHDCTVTEASADGSGGQTIQECNDSTSNAPCYRLISDATDCTDPTAPTLFQLCANSTCTPASNSSDSRNASVTCSLK